MVSLASLARDIEMLKKRNTHVELDKAWETSLTRKTTLAFSTFFVIGLYMQAIGVENPWQNAIVPSVGFLLSTLSLPLVKKIWIRHRIRERM